MTTSPFIAAVVLLSFSSILLLQASAPPSSTPSPSPPLTTNRVMLWMCLEFCQDSQEMIELQFAQINEHKSSITAISFEKYTLGPNSTLVDNNLTAVSGRINALGLEAWPLLSSYPHVPEFIDWMRDVFITPEPFIEACISAAKRFHYIGYNLDWEPTDDVTEEDGLAYAQFIDTFAIALHSAGLQLTVDVATWSPIWNYDAIEKGAADRVISMGTYTSSDSSFTSQLSKLVDTFGPTRSGVGLEMVNASTSARIPLTEVEWRFQQVAASGATEIDVWRMPVPPLWWPFIDKYMATSASK